MKMWRASSKWAMVMIVCVIAALGPAYAQLSPGRFPRRS